MCHQYFLIPISLSQYTPGSNWSNRPLLSGGDSSCSWVFCLCTGPKGESYTLQEGWQSVSPVAIMLIWNRVHSGGYSHERTQTSSFSCKVYWTTSSGMWSGVTAIQWTTVYNSKQWIVDTQDIVTVNQSAVIMIIRMRTLRSSIAWVDRTVWCPTYLSWGHMVDPGIFRED